MTIATVSEVFELLANNPINSPQGVFAVVMDIGLDGN